MLSKEEHIKFWIDSAESDLSVSDILYQTSKFSWCLFIGHLVLEKTLKAYYIYKMNEINPPRIHNLLKLADYCDLSLSVDQKIFFDKVNNFHLEGRYPEYKNEFYKIADKEFTDYNLQLIKESFQWLKSQMK